MKGRGQAGAGTQLKLLAVSGVLDAELAGGSGVPPAASLPALWLRKMLSRGGVRRTSESGGQRSAQTLSSYTAEVPLRNPPHPPALRRCPPQASPPTLAHRHSSRGRLG